MVAKTARRKGVYLPSPAEINRTCRDIQSQWTENERRRRAGFTDSGDWTPPTIRTLEGLLEEPETG